MTVRLRPGVLFHDGSAADASAIAAVLNEQLASNLKPLADDIDTIAAAGDRDVAITLRVPSAFMPEALMDVPIIKTGTQQVGTGAFMLKQAASNDRPTEVTSFDRYYLGRPEIKGIEITTYSNIRAAWAEMLRDRLDMLYEVGADALETMRSATNVSVYTFDRPYQYILLLNHRNPKIASAALRQALNSAIDRDAVVKNGLGGHGTPSAGPVSPHHWAYKSIGTTFTYAPKEAAAKIGKPIVLKCLTLAEPPFEQLAFTVKQQLKTIGVDLEMQELAGEQISATFANGNFEAILIDAASGWSLLRAYVWWHSASPRNVTKFASAKVDAALDRIRHAANDDEYRLGVEAFQQAVDADPPAVFLAWGDRSRAVTRNFNVQPEPGRDVLATLRLWRPSADYRKATTN